MCLQLLYDKTIRAFGDDIKNSDITIDKANDAQNKLAQKIKKFKSSAKPRNPGENQAL